jgi:hypothetical protein
MGLTFWFGVVAQCSLHVWTLADGFLIEQIIQ